MAKKQSAIFLLSTVAFLLPLSVFAQGVIIAGGCTAIADENWVSCLINEIINRFVWPIFIAIVIGMFILAGIQFMSAQGDPGKIDTAKKTVVWGIIAAMFGVLAFSMVFTVRWLTGL